MTIAYLTTSVSIFSLRKNLKHSFWLLGKSLIPAPGAVFSVYMITQITIGQLVTGLILLIVECTTKNESKTGTSVNGLLDISSWSCET
jgi:hypothetical protein